MYIFVFLWTPVLESASFLEIAHGWIFAAFMICITIGSSIYEFISKDIELDEIGRKGKYIFATASFAFLLSSFQRDEFQFLMLVFSIFELCCGVYFPWIGTLRSKYIPENSRATIMTLFRIPLNIIVAGVLYNVIIFICLYSLN